jgi:hypothetical protein
MTTKPKQLVPVKMELFPVAELQEMLDTAHKRAMRETFFLLGVDLEDARSIAEFRDSLRKQRARR